MFALAVLLFAYYAPPASAKSALAPCYDCVYCIKFCPGGGCGNTCCQGGLSSGDWSCEVDGEGCWVGGWCTTGGGGGGGTIAT